MAGHLVLRMALEAGGCWAQGTYLTSLAPRKWSAAVNNRLSEGELRSRPGVATYHLELGALGDSSRACAGFCGTDVRSRLSGARCSVSTHTGASY